MANVLNTLYPPVLPSWTQSFTISEGATIYYELPSYVTIGEVGQLEYSLRKNTDNRTILEGDVPTALMGMGKPDENGKYSINITNDNFVPDMFYKLQVRFAESAVARSEWSTVCLLKCIPEVSIDLDQFLETGDSGNYVFKSQIPHFSGKVSFAQETTEYLDSVVVTLVGTDDTGEVKYNEKRTAEILEDNTFKYYCNRDLINGLNYLLTVTVTTSNGYTKTVKYNFSTEFQSDDSRVVLFDRVTGNSITLSDKLHALPQSVFVTTEESIANEEGIIQIELITDGRGILNVRRKKHDSDDVWDTIYQEWVEDENPTHQVSVIDRTPEPGTLYDYNAYIDYKGIYSEIETYDTPVGIYPEENSYYLTGADKQVKVTLNPRINSMKTMVGDAITNTLGSQYPFIQRNGSMKYREFPLEGVIAFDGAGNNDFKQEILERIKKGSDSCDNNINMSANIYTSEEYEIDTFREREFREKVLEFLQDGEYKLFRSDTEGNILVRLTDVSLTPLEHTDRIINTFTATAHEIDAATVDKYLEYGLLTYGDTSPKSKVHMFDDGLSRGLSRTKTITLEGEVEPGEDGVNILDIFNKKARQETVPVGYKLEPHIEEIRLTIYPPSGENILEIDSQQIHISPYGRYNIADSSLKHINNLVLKSNENKNYEIEITYSGTDVPIEEAIPKQVLTTYVVGSISGEFDAGTNFIDMIKEKYVYGDVYDEGLTEQRDRNNIVIAKDKMQIKKIVVQAEPGTQFNNENITIGTGESRTLSNPIPSQLVLDYVKLKKADSDSFIEKWEYVDESSQDWRGDSYSNISRNFVNEEGKIQWNGQAVEAFANGGNYREIRTNIHVDIQYIILLTKEIY